MKGLTCAVLVAVFIFGAGAVDFLKADIVNSNAKNVSGNCGVTVEDRVDNFTGKRVLVVVATDQTTGAKSGAVVTHGTGGVTIVTPSGVSVWVGDDCHIHDTEEPPGKDDEEGEPDAPL